MVASSVEIVSLPDQLSYPNTEDQPAVTVKWSGGTGPFNVEYTWDDDPLFGNANGNQQTVTNNSVTSPDTASPPSALADTSDGTTWYVRANVVDTDDAGELADDHEFAYFDPIGENRYLYLLGDVGVAFDPTDDPGDWGDSIGGTAGADGNTRDDFNRFLYLFGNVGVGFTPTDDPTDGWGTTEGGTEGPDGETLEFNRFHYHLANVDDTQPCPFLFRLSSQTVAQGASLTVYGQGLVSADSPTDDWDAEVRLYETTDLDGTYQVLAKTDWAAGNTEDQITVTIPSNASSGFVAVVHTTTPTCDGSNFIGINITQVDADAQAGWWVEVWNLRNTQRIISALPDVAEADTEHIPGDIGKGHILLPQNHPDIPDILDRVNNVQRLVKVYQHNRFAYSFIPDDIDEDYTDDGARLARLYGEGQERILKWGRALFKDFPASVTRTRTRLYGSTENLIEWVNGEAESMIDDGGFEAGNEGSGTEIGTATDNLVQSPVRNGQFALGITPAALDDGYEWEISAQADRRLFGDLWVRAENTFDKTFRLELLAEDDTVLDFDTVSPANTTWQPLNVAAIPDGAVRMRVTQTAGTLEEFYLDDAAAYQRVQATVSRNRISPPMLSRGHVAGGLHSIELQIEDSSDLRQMVIFASAQPNQDYTLDLNVSGPAGEQVRFELRAGGESDSQVQTFTGLGTFDTLSFSGTAGPEETTIRLVITAVSAGAFSIFIDDTTLVPGQPAANGGEIVLDSLEPMQSRGTLDFVQTSFTRTHDSSGLTWPEDHPFEVDPRWTLWDLVDKLQGLGYRALFAPVDWRGGGDTGWEMSLFAPGNSVIDHSTVQDGPAILPGPTIEKVKPSSAAPLETVVYGEGPGGVWSVSELDAAALTALERREGFISNTAARSATTVFRAASHRLDTTSERGASFVADFTEDGDPLPYFDFLPEDALRAHLPGNEGRDHVPDATYRVAAVTSRLTGTGRAMSWQADFGNYALHQARIRDLIISRMLEREASENYRPGSGSVSSTGGGGIASSPTSSIPGIVPRHDHVLSDVVPDIEVPENLSDLDTKDINNLDDVSVPGAAEGDMLYLNDSGLWVVVSGTKDEGNIPKIQADGSVAWDTDNDSGGGGGGAVDPIQEKFGTPDTAFEFDSSSLSGLTALSNTPDAEDADTTVPGRYFVFDNAGSLSWCGRYVSTPTPPFTAITHLVGNFSENYNRGCLFLGVATPGDMDVLAFGTGSRNVVIERQTPTSHGSTIATGKNGLDQVWLAIRVNASDDVDYLYSWDGWLWRALGFGRDPSITIGSIGIAVKSENTNGTAGAFDFFRIWESALSMPGA